MLAPDDWQPVLAQRGFVAMLDHWYRQVELGRSRRAAYREVTCTAIGWRGDW